MSSDTIVAIAGLTASVVGIPAAYFFARRSRQRPHLETALDFDVLLDTARGISAGGVVTYDGRSVTRLSRSIVALWNERGDTVLGQDIVEDDPLRVSLASGDQLLQARLLYVSRPQCEIALQSDYDAPSVAMTFDFLDEGDGAIFEVIHEDSSAPDVLGTIRGATVRGKPRSLTLTSTSIRWMRESTRWTRLRRRAARHTHPRRRLAAVGVNMAGGIAVLTIALVFLLHRHGAHLVNARLYDLKTLTGQHRFANAVDQHGIEGSNWNNVPELALGLVLIAGLLYTLLGRSGIPRSLVAHEVHRDGEPAPDVQSSE